MSIYSRQQEARLQRYFESHPDVELLKYYGSRVKEAGDFLIRIGRQQVRVDHKSNTADKHYKDPGFIVDKLWLTNLTAYGLDRMDQEGITIPAISVSIYKHNNLWLMTTKHFPDLLVMDAKNIKPGKQTTRIDAEWLEDLGYNLKRIDCDGYQAYIMTLATFIKEVKDG